MRLKLRPSFAELLPSNDPGVVALTRTAEADRRPVAAADRHPFARPRGQPALRRGADAEAARAAAQRRQPGDLPRERRARVLRAEQVAVRLGGRSRGDPRSSCATRSASARTRCSSRWARRRVGRGDAASACRARAASSEKFPGRRVQQQGRDGDYVWIAALPPGGLFVENAGEALLNAANELIAADPPTRYHPQMRAEVAGPIVTGHRQPRRRSSATSCGSRSSA